MVNYRPASLKDALNIRSSEAVVPYAGGTDLMIKAPENVKYLFLDRIPEMRGISLDAGVVRIGAACTFTEVLNSGTVPGIMREAISQIAAPAIRNLGTMGGNIGSASAKADSVLIDFVVDAKILLASESGSRLVNIDDFYLGHKKTGLREDELIVEILIPKADLSNYYYKKVGARNALAISRVSFAGVFAMEGQKITKAACAFGAVADVVLRFKELEKMLIGKTLEEARSMKEDYIKMYDEAIIPIRGRVSAEYRKTVCINLLRDFLDKNGLA
jgi:CO/xanthine dehydrogenase FAD-binding subunit